jgi:accessory colonization factor AcfC
MSRLPILATAAFLAARVTAQAQDTVLFDPAIKHQPRDGVVRLYGAGGPHTAFKKVADLWMRQTGNEVAITAGPEGTWSQKAQGDADIIWGTSEQSITAFLQTYKTFSSNQVEPIYVRPTVIAVRKGNPKSIAGFDDLLKDGIRIVVTEGSGVANTSGTGTWEDVAGRLGRLSDIEQFRRNIVSFSTGSGASFKAFQDLEADAWITWPDWTVTKADVLDAVPIKEDRRIWRDLNLAVAPDADPQARDFADFLVTPEAQALMRTEGWER